MFATCAAVLLGVALLPPAAHHLADGEPGDAQLVERVLYVLEPLVTDDRFDLLHLDLALLDLRRVGRHPRVRDRCRLARWPALSASPGDGTPIPGPA